MLPDPENLPLSIYAAMLLYALVGWAAAELPTLAQLMNGTLEERLRVVQKVVVSIAAGVGTALAVLYFLAWPKMAAYILDFLAAMGGARYLQAMTDAFISTAQGFLSRVRGSGSGGGGQS